MDTSRASLSLDWLSFTFHWNSAALAPISNYFVPHQVAQYVTGKQTQWVAEKPSNGYRVVLSEAGNAGLRVMASEPNSPMGVHVSWSGSALRTVSPRAVLRNALSLGGKCRRIDIAFDIPDAVDFDELHDALKTGRAVRSSRTYSRIQSNSGNTIYVGSRTSEMMLRIYDKQAESGLDHAMTRFELECKGQTAESIAKYVDDKGLDGMQDVIHSFCSFPHLRYLELWFASQDTVEMPPKKEPRRDTKHWLMTIVAPSLARVMAEDHDFFVAFLRKVYTIGGVGEVQQPDDPFNGAADFEPVFPQSLL